MPYVLIVPIAFDLCRVGNSVSVGPGTVLACNCAIDIARSEKGKGRDSRLLTTATRAGKEHDSVIMGKVIQEYLGGRAPDIICEFKEAEEFSTLGEILAVADYLAQDHSGPLYKVEYGRALFTVKSWHAPRVRMIVRHIFKQRGITIPFEVKTHQLKVGLGVRLREAAAYIQNWYRLTRMA